MNRLLTLLVLIFVWPLLAPFNPQPSAITEKFFPEMDTLPNVTPALKKDNGYTDYEELIAFLEGLEKAFPDRVTLRYIGESKKGKAIPLIEIKPVKASEASIRVWMQGGLHGDEQASTESLLYLLYEVLHNKNNADVLETIHLAVVPMANIDGYLKQRRNNAENLDLNRDQTKLMAAESGFLKKAYTDFQPQVAMDFHEYRPFRRDFLKMGTFGVTGAYDVMFLYTGNLNVPEEQRIFTSKAFLEPTRAALDQHQLSHHDYVTTTKHFGAVQFSRGAHNARSSATNYALLNAISTLVEVRGVGIGRTSFKRRIFTGFLIGQTFLKQAVANAPSVRKLTESNPLDSTIVLQHKRKVYEGEMNFIDVDQVTKITLPVTFRDALQSHAGLQRNRPEAYLIPAEFVNLKEKIEIFGLNVKVLSAPTTFQVEHYRVVQATRQAAKYEKMTMQEVITTLEREEITMPAGSFYISSNQQNARILTELLEPETPNSFVSFGLIPAKTGDLLPIYRIPKN